MSFELNPSDIARVAALPSVKQAAAAGASLIELWPLTDAKQMDNDAKYAENLQVRVTRMIAAILTGQEVTMPDAEFVYEGADEIPGRPQEIVDALLAANDAYDGVAEYSETGDIELPLGAVDELGVDWSAEATAAAKAVMETVERTVGAEARVGERLDASADPEEVARRFAVVLLAVDAVLAAILGDGTAADDSDTAELAVRRALPVALYANELCERVAVPRLCPDVEGFRAMVHAVTGSADPQASVEAVADVIAPLAETEWAKHREDVLWDPVEAKKRAKEEDERKSKEALAAKFAHIKDDPNKETVEL